MDISCPVNPRLASQAHSSNVLDKVLELVDLCRFVAGYFNFSMECISEKSSSLKYCQLVFIDIPLCEKK